jgi:hypothetical protein
MLGLVIQQLHGFELTGENKLACYFLLLSCAAPSQYVRSREYLQNVVPVFEVEPCYVTANCYWELLSWNSVELRGRIRRAPK